MAAAWDNTKTDQDREMFIESRQYIQMNNMRDLFRDVLIDTTIRIVHVYGLKCVYYKEEISFKEKQFEGSIKLVKLVRTLGCRNVGENPSER